MFVEIDGLRLHYERNITKDDNITVVILHGWGGSLKTMSGIFKLAVGLERNVISLDLPHFGQSDSPPDSFGIYEYAEIVKKFLDSLGIEKAVLIGHSFGGRIAIILGAKYKIADKIVLIDSAGAKPRFSLKKKIKIWRYKIRKKLKLKQGGSSGSADYKALPESMQRVFVRIVNTHLDCRFKEIDAPVLLIWGRNDKDTPLYMAKRMNKKIKDCGLIIIENAAHFSFIEKYFEVSLILESFLS